MPLLIEEISALSHFLRQLIADHEESGAQLFRLGPRGCGHDLLTLGEVVNLVDDHLKEAADAYKSANPPF